jgi:hypothetical protein
MLDMELLYEFRILEKYAHYIFKDNEGEKLGKIARKIEISPDDPRFQRIEEMNLYVKKQYGDIFYAGWKIHRYYTKDEISKAKLFLLCPGITIDVTGEEFGTKYDERTVCPLCKSGAKQNSPLIFDLKKLPKGKDIIQTISGEILVSRRLASIFDQNHLLGAEFSPIYDNQNLNNEAENWSQLFSQGRAEIVSPTKTGISPFDVDDVDGLYSCPNKDLAGRVLISEAHVVPFDIASHDIVGSKKYFGVRQGAFRPFRLLLVSPRLHSLLESNKIRGCGFELAYFV